MTVTSVARLPVTRGRRTALIIGVPFCLALVALTGLSLVANLGVGHYPVSYTVSAGIRSLAVNTSGGQILIRQAPAGRATINGTAKYSIVRSALTERTTGRVTTVGYRCPMPFGDCELDATVDDPAALPVTASVAGGNATVTGTTAAVSVSSGGGDITAIRTAGPLKLNTSGGNIQASDVTSATVKATSGGGDIEIVFASVPQDVTVSTSGGNITVVLPPGNAQYRVTAHTDGGNTSYPIPTSPSSTHVITATSGGGDITIRQR